jgi:hypothetical protein
MRNNIIWWIVCLVLVFIFSFTIYQIARAETLTCPEGQKVESVLITPAVIAVPAVTHTEVVVDTPAWDEVVVDSPAYTSCDNVGAPSGDYKNSSCTQVSVFWWQNVYKKVSHPAVTHIVHHEAITHEVVVVDVPAVEGTPAVYEDQCVVDTSYVPPTPPAPAQVEPTAKPEGTSVFRKLCNLNKLFGVGFCPASDKKMGVIYQDLYSTLIQYLKAGK